MGDPLNNHSIANRPVLGPTPASSGTNNVSDNLGVMQADARPRQPAGPVASLRTVDAPGVMSFLQEFQSLAAFNKAYPELATVTLPDTIDDEIARSFTDLLDSVLDPTHKDLTRKHAPADILRGLKELTARERGEAATAKHGMAEKPQEEKPSAGRPRRRGGNSLPDFLLNREIGAPSSKFSAVKHNAFASMATVMGRNRERMREFYEGRIERSLKSLEKKCPQYASYIWILRIINDKFINQKASAIQNCWVTVLDIDADTSLFFRDLFCQECTLRVQEHMGRFFDELLRAPSEGSDDAEAGSELADCEPRFQAKCQATIMQISREILLGLLNFERSQPGFKAGNAFRKSIIPSLVTLCERRNSQDARETLMSALATECEGMDEIGGKKLLESQLYAIHVRSAAMTELFDREGFTRSDYDFAAEIGYYFALFGTGSEKFSYVMGRAIGGLLVVAGPDPSEASNSANDQQFS